MFVIEMIKCVIPLAVVDVEAFLKLIDAFDR